MNTSIFQNNGKKMANHADWNFGNFLSHHGEISTSFLLGVVVQYPQWFGSLLPRNGQKIIQKHRNIS